MCRFLGVSEHMIWQRLDSGNVGINKFHMNLFCPVLYSRKKKVRWGDIRKYYFFFCIQLGLAVVMTTDLVMNPCSAVCKTFAALLSPYVSHFPYLPAGHNDHLIE